VSHRLDVLDRAIIRDFIRADDGDDKAGSEGHHCHQQHRQPQGASQSLREIAPQRAFALDDLEAATVCHHCHG
jgi:hypothetical protein